MIGLKELLQKLFLNVKHLKIRANKVINEQWYFMIATNARIKQTINNYLIKKYWIHWLQTV